MSTNIDPMDESIIDKLSPEQKLFEDVINAELKFRGIIQWIDENGDATWDDSKLYWARRMFIEGAIWANNR